MQAARCFEGGVFQNLSRGTLQSCSTKRDRRLAVGQKNVTRKQVKKNLTKLRGPWFTLEPFTCP